MNLYESLFWQLNQYCCCWHRFKHFYILFLKDRKTLNNSCINAAVWSTIVHNCKSIYSCNEENHYMLPVKSHTTINSYTWGILFHAPWYQSILNILILMNTTNFWFVINCVCDIIRRFGIQSKSVLLTTKHRINRWNSKYMKNKYLAVV